MATNAELKDTHVKLVALLGAKIKAIESLIALQQAYCDHVEPGDSAAINDLGNFNKRLEYFSDAYNQNQGDSYEAADLLTAQITEVSADIGSISSVFADFSAATAERVEIFSNFSGK